VVCWYCWPDSCTMSNALVGWLILCVILCVCRVGSYPWLLLPTAEQLYQRFDRSTGSALLASTSSSSHAAVFATPFNGAVALGREGCQRFGITKWLYPTANYRANTRSRSIAPTDASQGFSIGDQCMPPCIHDLMQRAWSY
jgi:hypothetical protein